MSEVFLKVLPITIGNAKGHFLNEECSIRDVLRWLIDQSDKQEVFFQLMELNNETFK